MNIIMMYPAIFHEAEEGGYWVEFPDLPGCVTQGNDAQEAYLMAVEALGLMLTTEKGLEDNIPEPSDVKDIECPEGCKIVIIPFDFLEYKKKYYNKAVKKTLSIPEWLNDEAMKAGVNFSQVLKEALIQKLC